MDSENIFLFVPNIIGYFRIVFGLISFYYMPFDYQKASVCYLLSAGLDAFDGYAARALGQSTKFGAILDQITDRCATMALVMVLSVFYPKYMLLFQVLNIVDIASHWIHIWVSIMQGKSSHKFVDPSGNPILRLYYTSRPVLFFMCAGNELFFSMLYLMYFTQGPIIPFIKIGLFKAVFLVSVPIAFVKFLISLLHLVVACINMGIIDVKEREDAKRSSEAKSQ
ncbi:Csa-PI synthase-like protein [Leptotrombidium deliense]|uniref:CDP-diacylglycerol--inositol 3-phosphatidyltransferase n=1 Tax=Leptotrombidium deliense TaxID=299467 RepID=A0A443SDK0_9ACAR|nr:Csa-PI synthase-like protein [Leptotrombidium deliense]